MSNYLNFKDLTGERLRTEAAKVRDLVNEMIEKIASVSTRRTFHNTVQPSIDNDFVTNRMDVWSISKDVHPDKTVRDVATELEVEMNKFSVDVSYNQRLYDAFVDYYNNGFEKERESLTPEEVRSVEHGMRDYRRLGMHLSDEQKEEAKAIRKEMSELSTAYEKVLNEWTRTFEYTKDQLTGLPDDWFGSRGVEGKENTFKVTLAYPDIIPLLEFCSVESTRREVYVAFRSKGGEENTKRLDDMRLLRFRLARLLGYNDWADYATEKKMVRTGKTMREFVTNLRTSCGDAYRDQLGELNVFARDHATYPLGKEQIDFWDKSFYLRLYRQEKSGFDPLVLREYFTLDSVVTGTLKLYEHLLGVKFVEVTTHNKWHTDVTFYRTFDEESGLLLGEFYLDLYPRPDEGKYGHACVAPLYQSCYRNGKKEPGLGVMICNFSEHEKPTFDEVETFFHEFGHMVHGMCSDTQLAEFGGTSVERDFVEAPSQMLEFWCYEEGPLNRLSNETVPSELVNQLRVADKTMKLVDMFTQLSYAQFDINLHSGEPTSNCVESWWSTVKDVTNLEDSGRTVMAGGFGHLMSGYSAGYYGYLYAEVTAANMYYRRFAANPLSKEEGRRYRNMVIGLGSSRDALDFMRDYLEGDIEPRYLLKAYGLEEA